MYTMFEGSLTGQVCRPERNKYRTDMRKYAYVAENHANKVPDRTTMPKGISVIAASPGHELVFHKWKSFAEGRNKRNKWQRHLKESRTMDKHKQKTTNNTHYGHNFWLKCTILSFYYWFYWSLLHIFYTCSTQKSLHKTHPFCNTLSTTEDIVTHDIGCHLRTLCRGC